MKKKWWAVLLICAMTLVVAPALSAVRTEAAGIAVLFNKKDLKTALTSDKATNIYVGGAKVRLQYNIGGRTSGVDGKWASTDPSVIKVNQKGACTALDNGVAYISFTYKEDGKSKVLKCKLKAKTRAGAVTLTPSGTDYNGTLEVGQKVSFNTTVLPIAKAKAVNPKIESTYSVYYDLFTDSACKTLADDKIAVVDDIGTVTAKGVGTVYLRAIAKNSATATKNNVTSPALPITIKSPTMVRQSASNQFEVSSTYTDIISVIVKNKTTGTVLTTSPLQYGDNGDDKKFAKVTTNQSPLRGIYTVIVNGTESFDITCDEARPTRLELQSSNAVLDKMYADSNGYPKAYIYFTLYDQFGNDITLNPLYPAGAYIGICTEMGMLNIVEQGVAVMDFETLKNTAPVVGSTYSIKLIYTGGATLDTVVTLGTPAMVNSVSLKGIYTYVDPIVGYKQVASPDLNEILTGTEIKSYANSMQTPGAYYLLISAKDQYGNALVGAGIPQEKVPVFMQSGTTGMALETQSDGKVKSAGSITIDSEKYLAYPLKAVKLTSGKVDVMVSGGGSVSQMKLTIAETAGIQKFTVNGTAYIIKGANGSYASQDTELTYVVMNTADNVVTNYDTLVRLTNAIATADGKAHLFDPNIIQSANQSIFWWEKQSDGSAKLFCRPNFVPTIVGTTISEVAVDKITTLKGTANENSTGSILMYVTTQ